MLRRRSDLAFWAAISLALTVAVWLRWSGLAAQSLWADEGYTVWISQFSPKEMWGFLRTDTSAPLYYILVHYWSAVFGDSESSLRGLSALFGTLSLPLFYLIARKILVSRTSVALAAMLYSLSFFQIWYAKEARCYALLVLLSLASVYCALLCLEKTSILRLLALAIALSLSLYTHNMALFYLPGLAVLWFTYPSDITMGARMRSGLIVAAITLFFYIPWLRTLHQQAQSVHQSFWVPKPHVGDLLKTLCVLSGFDTRTFQDVFRAHFHFQKLFGFWTWAPLFLLVFIFCVVGTLYSVRSVDRSKGAALLVYSLLPLGLVFFFSRLSTSSVYLDKVFIGTSALLPLIVCAPVGFQSGNRKPLFQFAALLALVATAVSAFGYLGRERREDWRGATEYLVKIPERQRQTVVILGFCQVLINYYSTHLFKTYPPVDTTGLMMKFDPADPGSVSILQDDRTADPVAVLSRAIDSGKYNEIDFALQPTAGPVGETTEYLRTHCTSVEVAEFHWLEVRRCFVQPPVTAAASLGQAASTSSRPELVAGRK